MLFRSQADLFSYYPNPVKNYLILKSKNHKFGPTKLDVCDVLGHPILSRELVEGENRIDLFNFPKGIYWLVVKNGALSQSEIFVIQ